MDIVGIGTDIVECLRIGRMIEEHGELFLSRVFTPREIRYCQARKHATEHFAGRWAAKEAVLKCLGTGWRKGICWTDMEVRNDPDGAPKLHLGGAARERAESLHIADIHITISHCRAYATAYALAVSGEKK
jgi:holo-[acyl-carrier protein] synthase